ncbi:putative signal peptidase complex subunit 2, partial [Fragariocoptes setiger]
MPADEQEQNEVDETEYITVDKWDGGAVKSVLDETAKQVILQHFNYVESNLLTDLRLFLCSLPVASAFFALIYDFMYPFPESAPVLRVCVYSYIVLMIILTLYSTFVESNIILIAYKDKKKIKVSSTMKRFDDKYTLSVELGEKKPKSLTKSVSNYFDSSGTFLQQRFENDVIKLHKSKSN